MAAMAALVKPIISKTNHINRCFNLSPAAFTTTGCLGAGFLAGVARFLRSGVSCPGIFG